MRYFVRANTSGWCFRRYRRESSMKEPLPAPSSYMMRSWYGYWFILYDSRMAEIRDWA